MEDNFSTDGVWGDGSGSNVSDGERWGAADEASLARLPLTSCCVARLLTGHRPVLVHGLGAGDPWIKGTGCPRHSAPGGLPAPGRRHVTGLSIQRTLSD